MSRISITSLADIDQAAAAFLEESQGYQVMAFSGEMGAGKTTFIQAISRCLGITAEVNSPTFSLVNEYFTPEGDSVYHFDLYRIEDPAELFDMGYEEYFYSGSLCLIEWPEKASHLVPDDALRVKIQVMDDRSRELQF
jgi:tRNA threonylcarbamoyladenosine biosynthesis protein TsaE